MFVCFLERGPVAESDVGRVVGVVPFHPFPEGNADGVEIRLAEPVAVFDVSGCGHLHIHGEKY